MSALLFGVGAFFVLSEWVPQAGSVFLAAIVSFTAAGVLHANASKLASRAARALVGLVLVFGAIWFGALHDIFPMAVLWAGILFGTLDTLGKMTPSQRVAAETLS